MRRISLLILLGLGVAAITFATFSDALRHEFVMWDDDINIYNNPNLRGLSLERVQWMFTDVQYMRRYIPLSYLGWSIIYEFSRLNPFWYHAVPLALHTLVAVAFFLTLLRLTKPLEPARDGQRSLESFRFLCCAMGTLLWSVHPMRTEVVAWAGGLMYTQATLYLLLSLLAYLYLFDMPRGGIRRWVFYGFSVLAYAASTLSYPIVLGYLPVLVVYDIYRRRGQIWEREGAILAVEKAPYAIVAAILMGVTFWAKTHAKGIWEPPPTLEQFGILARVMQAFYVWAYYIWRPMMPVHHSPVYTDLVNSHPTGWPLILALLWVIGTSILVQVTQPRRPTLTGMGWVHLAFFLPLLILGASCDVPGLRWSDATFEFILVALLGLSAVFWRLPSIKLDRAGMWITHVLFLAPLFGLALYVGRSYVRQGDWPFVFSFIVVVEISVIAVLLRRRLPGLLAVWSCYLLFLVPMLGLTEHPHYPADRYNYVIGITASLLLIQAMMWLASRPLVATIPLTWGAMAAQVVVVGVFTVLSFRQTLVWTDSYTLFNHIIANLGDDPYRRDIYWRLAKVQMMNHQPTQAQRSLEKIVQIAPDDPETVLFAADRAFLVGQGELGVSYLDRAMVIAPQNPSVVAFAAQKAMQVGLMDRAQHYLEVGLQSRPDEAALHFYLGVVLANQGRFAESLAHLKRADQLAPRQPQIIQAYNEVLRRAPANDSLPVGSAPGATYQSPASVK